MPSLATHTSDKFVRTIWVGNSGAGKTGGLAPLVKAGYKLRILDFDNGLDNLVNNIKAINPALLAAVEYETLRDDYIASPLGLVVKGSPKAFVRSCKLLDKWSDESIPREWGPEYVLVLDSLTNFSRAAFAWAVSINPGSKDPRQWYAAAQKAIEDMLAALTSESFHANVIVISHIEYMTDPAGNVKGFPTAVGKALGPKIARFFNNLIMTESSGTGTTVRRSIKTVPSAAIDLKNAAPGKVSPSYPLETGIADIFAALKS